MTGIEATQNFLANSVKALVDTPEEVTITCEEADDRVTFTIVTSKKECGQIIGKDGKIAAALRVLTRSVSVRVKSKSAYVVIQDK